MLAEAQHGALRVGKSGLIRMSIDGLLNTKSAKDIIPRADYYALTQPISYCVTLTFARPLIHLSAATGDTW